MILLKTLKVVLVAACLMLLQGCASYYSHYGSFDSINSAGEQRKFVVSWQSAEYPEWYWADNTTTAIALETQCSTRKLYFIDASTAQNAASFNTGCVANQKGIVVCGDPQLDLDANGRAFNGSEQVCGSISNSKEVDSITALGNELLIKIDCWPASTQYEVDGEKKNRDYLKYSIVPYTIATKKVPRYSLDDKVPVLSEKICKEKK
ncbi:MAG: hypothetical protein H7A01_06715 [Hahellaceae bacterium]|nr:hypothetical protein [Hahellaceae bacterium]MCP5211795.1 hypothetical protein [Hahellaceae bacterium]